MSLSTLAIVFFCCVFVAGKPAIKEYSLKYLIQENDPVKRMVGTIITDIEGAGFTMDMFKSLTFLLSRPNCCFHLDDKTSVLSISSLIDLESICSNRLMSAECSSGQGNLELTVNLWTDRQLVAVIRVHISVLDVNDNVPKFKKSQIERRVSEASHKIGHSIFLEAAFDEDIAPENARIEYGLSEHHAVFQLRLNRLRQPYLLLLRDLDAEVQTHFSLRLRAWNSANHKQWNELMITIVVMDFNDNAPVFNGSTFTVMVKENTAPQTAIYQLVAKDADSSSVLRFDIDQDVNADIRNIFAVTNNGTVFVISSSLDYETHQRYRVPVIVSDGLYEARAVLDVLLQDENDEKPQIVQNPSVIEVMENGGSGLLIGQVIITDKDGPHTNGKIKCHHQAGQAGLAFLQSAPRNAMSLVYDIRTEISFDREKLPQVLVVLVCSDGWNSSSIHQLTSSFTITVNILDANDNAPAFHQAHYTAHIIEDSPVGAAVIEVNADDLDIGINGKIVYGLHIDSPVFHIDPSSGLITVQGPLDRESIDRFQASVVAFDSGSESLTSTVNITIIIDDANDHTPNLVAPFELTVTENSGPQLIGQLRHEDGDIGPNAEVVYSRLWPNDDVITVSDNGTVFATRSLDREAQNRHCLRVTLRDNGIAGRRQSSGEVCVKVMDVNDNEPRLINPRELSEHDDATSSSSQAISLSIYESPGHLITHLQAVDDDELDNARITYAIRLPDILPATIFTLNSTSGQIFLARTLSYKHMGIHPIKVIASDCGSPVLSDEKILHLHINKQAAHGLAKANREQSWMDRNNAVVVVILSCITICFIGMFITAIACMLKPCCQPQPPIHTEDQWMRKFAPARQAPLKMTATLENITASVQENLLVNGGSDMSNNFLTGCIESDMDMKPFDNMDNQIYGENDPLTYIPSSAYMQTYAGHSTMSKNLDRIEYGVCSQCPTINSYGSLAYATFGHYIDINKDDEIKEDFQSDSGRGASEDDTSRTNVVRLKFAGPTTHTYLPMSTLNGCKDEKVQQEMFPKAPDIICDEINQLFFHSMI